jgi:hypothetical protein
MSKLGDLLTKNKIDARRVIAASHDLERRLPADRKLARDKALLKAGKIEKNEELAKAKPRSGRPVTAPMMDRAVGGKPVPGPVKTRIVKAVNSVLKAKKQAEISLRDAF